jgi:hypothetical protein
MSPAKKTDGGGDKTPKKKKSGAASAAAAKPTYRIPRDGGWASAWKLTAAIGVVGALGSILAANEDPHRFAFSWLFAFMAFLAIALGSLFYVLTHHLTGAGWGVTTRRTAELFMAGLPVFAILFVPIALHMDELYPWMHHWREAELHHGEGDEAHGDDSRHSSVSPESSPAEGLLGSVAQAQDQDRDTAEEGAGAGEADHGAVVRRRGQGHASEHHTPEHAAHEEVIESKLAYLDRDFFLGRAVLYFVIWTLLAMFFFRSSTEQDVTRDLKLTRRMQSASPVATFAFALTLTFAAFDWMMSLEPTWFSTIFGVQYFAVGAVSALATLIVTMHALRSASILGRTVSDEHFHEVGKLLFGFIVFWAYITFSQFMLIWYASIPEETTYYHLRWAGGWRTFSLIMIPVRFLIPFFLLISRNVKRRVAILAFGAGWVLVSHVLEVFWLVMPYASPNELTVHLYDLAALFAVGGVYLTVVFFLMSRYPLIPVGDPRVERSMHHQVG